METQKRYATLEEAQKLEAGVTGKTFLFEGVLFEMLEGKEVWCWIAWHHEDRSGSWDMCREIEAPNLTKLFNESK